MLSAFPLFTVMMGGKYGSKIDKEGMKKIIIILLKGGKMNKLTKVYKCSLCNVKYVKKISIESKTTAFNKPACTSHNSYVT